MFIIGYARSSSIPVLGAFHSSEITYFFGASNKTDWMAPDAISKYRFFRTHLIVLKLYQFTSPAIMIQIRQLIH